MKILFTGGVTGGHFYPIIAVAEDLSRIAKEKKLFDVELYFAAPDPYNERALYEHGIAYIHVPAGKARKYFSLLNLSDAFVTIWGIISAFFKVFSLYPDIVFGKGGYGSFPVLFVSRLLRIPIMIHESDTSPGKVNRWAGKFADRIAISYPEAAQFFPKERVAFTGNPVRKEIRIPVTEGAYEFLKLERDVPVIFITGGSQGAQKINNAVLEILPDLLNNYQIIHQCGNANFEEPKGVAETILKNHPHKDRYRPFPYLNSLALSMVAGVSDLVISRAGSTIFEIALWGKPSIIIPIPEPLSHDQVKNAYSYARGGGTTVIEEANLGRSLFLAEIKRIMDDPTKRRTMSESAKNFSRGNASSVIAEEIINIALEHEK